MDFNDLKGMFGELKTRMDAGIERVRRDMAVMVGIGDDLKRFIATHLRDGEARGLERATTE